MSTSNEDKKKMTLTEAAAYLGVSHRKMTKLLKEGALKFSVDPLDKRRKLVNIKNLDDLKKASLHGG